MVDGVKALNSPGGYRGDPAARRQAKGLADESAGRSRTWPTTWSRDQQDQPADPGRADPRRGRAGRRLARSGDRGRDRSLRRRVERLDQKLNGETRRAARVRLGSVRGEGGAPATPAARRAARRSRCEARQEGRRRRRRPRTGRADRAVKPRTPSTECDQRTTPCRPVVEGELLDPAHARRPVPTRRVRRADHRRGGRTGRSRRVRRRRRS